MKTQSLRDRIRDAIRSGMLPCHRSWRTWAGPGTGRRCSACMLEIAADQVEYEVEVNQSESIFVHMACYQSWVEECHARRAEVDGDGDGRHA